jgi:hypothetical protein
MAETDIELLARCGEFALRQIHSVEEKILKELETSGATRLVMGLRLCRLQRAVVAVGMFSIFESMLQGAMNWKEAIAELDKYLLRHGEVKLATRISDYFKAINALKHGFGASYTKLLNSQNLEFKVRGQQDSFFEGDVSEVGVLVDADDNFLRLGSELIGEVCAVIQARDGIRV